MNPKKCSYEGCNANAWTGGKQPMCKSHMSREPKPSFTMSSSPRKKTASKIVKNHLKRKPSGEAAIFEVVWNTRPRVSFISGVDLGGDAKACMFAHILNKGKYPRFKLYDKNIQLLTCEEHSLLDAGTQQQREDYAARKLKEGIIVKWEKIDMLREILKQEYDKNTTS